MYLNLTQNLTFSPTGFSLGRTDPTSVSKRQNTRGFIFFRFLRDLTWLSLLALNSLVNIRTILTYGFYVQKRNCLTVFTEQLLIQNLKVRVISRRDKVLYSVSGRKPAFILEP